MRLRQAPTAGRPSETRADDLRPTRKRRVRAEKQDSLLVQAVKRLARRICGPPLDLLIAQGCQEEGGNLRRGGGDRPNVCGGRSASGRRKSPSGFPFVITLVLATVTCTEGARRLREFQVSPAEVRDEFFGQVRAATERQRAIRDYDLYEGHADPGRWIEQPKWGEEWRRRASLVRARAEGRLGDIEEQREALLAIPAPSYFAKLTGAEVPRTGGRVNCPNPDHEDHHPDCLVYAGQGWRCFACQEQGGIYQLGALVWGLDTRGPDFMELHRRLCGAFGIERKAA